MNSQSRERLPEISPSQLGSRICRLLRLDRTASIEVSLLKGGGVLVSRIDDSNLHVEPRQEKGRRLEPPKHDKEVVDLLGLERGHSVELATLRNGAVMFRRLDESKPDENGGSVRHEKRR
jgi:hypothetical protein